MEFDDDDEIICDNDPMKICDRYLLEDSIQEVDDDVDQHEIDTAYFEVIFSHRLKNYLLEKRSSTIVVGPQ